MEALLEEVSKKLGCVLSWELICRWECRKGGGGGGAELAQLEADSLDRHSTVVKVGSDVKLGAERFSGEKALPLQMRFYFNKTKLFVGL